MGDDMVQVADEEEDAGSVSDEEFDALIENTEKGMDPDVDFSGGCSGDLRVPSVGAQPLNECDSVAVCSSHMHL